MLIRIAFSVFPAFATYPQAFPQLYPQATKVIHILSTELFTGTNELKSGSLFHRIICQVISFSIASLAWRVNFFTAISRFKAWEWVPHFS